MQGNGLQVQLFDIIESVQVICQVIYRIRVDLFNKRNYLVPKIIPGVIIRFI